MLNREIEENIRSHSTQLAEKAQKLDLTREVIKSGHLRYGLLNYPANFKHPLVNIFRSTDGKIYHDFDSSKYLIGDKEIYFDTKNGSDSTGNGLKATPYKTLNKCLDVANSSTETKIIIKGLSEIVQLTEFNKGDNKRFSIATGKVISIIPDNSTEKLSFINGRNNSSLSWASSDGVYKCARTLVSMVMDFKRLDGFGVPIPYDKKTTLAECVSTPYSYYTDGTSLWVNRNGVIPDSDVWATLNTWNFALDISSSTLYLKNIKFYSGADKTASCDITGDINSNFIHENCLFWGGYVYSTNDANADNGLSVSNVGKTYGFNSICAYNGKDGFNYHYIGIPTATRRDCTVFEYNCIGYQNGLFKTTSNNNASTCHEGATIYRVGTIGFETFGPVIADVNGCNVYCVDCHSRDSLIKDMTVARNSAYYFDNVSASLNGIAYLENCDGGGFNNYAISSDNTFDIKLLKFNGAGKVLNSVWNNITQIESI